MPFYYFGLHDGTRVNDPDGLEMRDDSAALAHAKQVARELVKNNSSFAPLKVIVTYGTGRTVGRVPLRDAEIDE